MRTESQIIHKLEIKNSNSKCPKKQPPNAWSGGSRKSGREGRDKKERERETERKRGGGQNERVQVLLIWVLINVCISYK